MSIEKNLSELLIRIKIAEDNLKNMKKKITETLEILPITQFKKEHQNGK